MDAKQKVTRAWAVRYPRGGLHIWAVMPTKREAITAFCDGGGYSAPDAWKEWRKRGYRAVKVEIREVN